jgi:hypothetical protein
MESNELDINVTIVNKILAKIIESDPDLIGIIKNLLKKGLEKGSYYGEEKLEDLIASKTDLQMLDARLHGLEYKLGMDTWTPYEYNSMSILERVKALERVVDNLEIRINDLTNSLEYGKYSNRFN